MEPERTFLNSRTQIEMNYKTEKEGKIEEKKKEEEEDK